MGDFDQYLAASKTPSYLAMGETSQSKFDAKFYHGKYQCMHRLHSNGVCPRSRSLYFWQKVAIYGKQSEIET